jgi:hypothetical protein
MWFCVANQNKKEQERKHISASEAAGADLYFKFPPEMIGRDVASLYTHQIADFVRASGSDSFRQYNVPEPSVWPRVADNVADKLTRDEIPGLIAEGVRKGYKLAVEDLKKEENTPSKRIKSALKWVLGIGIGAVITILVAWYMGLLGIR